MQMAHMSLLFNIYLVFSIYTVSLSSVFHIDLREHRVS